MMDLGEPFKRGMKIDPGEDGTFIVYIDVESHLAFRRISFGFTTIDDLLIWMAKHGAKARVTELSEGDVVAVAMDQLIGIKRTPEGIIRRTTAAEIIAEREQRFAEAAKAQAAEYAAKTLAERVAKAEKAWSDADKPTNAA